MSAPSLPPSEEFRPRNTWKQQAPGQAVLLAVLVFLMWFLLGFLLSSMGVPAGGWIGLVVALGIAALMWQQRKKAFHAASAQAVLVAGPEGVEVQEVHRRLRLRWVDMTDIGPAPAKTGYRTPGSTGRGVAAALAAVADRPVAVFGATSVEMAANIPVVQRAALDQQAREQRPHVELATYAPDFPAGRLGDWFRAHRPDLLA